VQGRAKLQASVTLKETPEGKPQTVLLDIVLDGLNAPVSAGSFMDLVLRGFYDGMEVGVIRVQQSRGHVARVGLHGNVWVWELTQSMDL
jgi:hypothetical protein